MTSRVQAFGVIADDLTGACDVGGAMAGSGRRVVVDLGTAALHEFDATDVVIVSSGLRDAQAPDVLAVIKRCHARLMETGARLGMLKVDSTLRGPIEAIIRATLTLGDWPAIVIGPAFPAQGRLLKGGRLEVNGADGDVDLVAKLTDVGSTVTLVAVDDLARLLAATRTSSVKPESLVVVVDAENDADLKSAVATWTEFGRSPLLVGSAGIGRHIGHSLPSRERATDEPAVRRARQPNEVRDPWILVVAGSPSEVTCRQLEALEDAFSCDVSLVDPTGITAAPARAVRDKPWNVSVFRSPAASERDNGETSSALASVIESVVGTDPERFRLPDGLVLVGGDTAARVLGTLRAMALVIRGEVEPGIPLMSVSGGSLDGVLSVTKAGGFGHDGTLVQVVEELMRRAEMSDRRAPDPKRARA